jgi:hypothetical protein
VTEVFTSSQKRNKITRSHLWNALDVNGFTRNTVPTGQPPALNRVALVLGIPIAMIVLVILLLALAGGQMPQIEPVEVSV